MKRRSSSKKSRTNYRRLRTMKDADVQLTPEHPEASVEHVVRGIVRNGLKAVPRKASSSLRIGLFSYSIGRCMRRLTMRGTLRVNPSDVGLIEDETG